MDEPRTQSVLLGWIVGLAITVSVLLRRDKDVRHKFFVFFSGNVTLYYVFDFIYAWRGEPWLERAALAVAVVLPQGGIRFFRAFATGSAAMGRLGPVTIALGAILLAAAIHPAWLGPAVGPSILAYVLGFLLVALLDLNVRARHAPSRGEAARIRYIVVGGLVALGFQVLERLGHVVRVEVPPIGLATTMIYLFIMSQAIARQRMLDLYEMLGRFAVFIAMGICLALIFTALVVWAGRGIAVNIFLASLVILIIFDPLRDLVERKIAAFFFKERRVLEEEVAALRRRLSHVISIDLMIDAMLMGFASSRRVTHAALYLIDHHGRGYDLRGAVPSDPPQVRVESPVVRRRLLPFAQGGAVTAATLGQRAVARLGEGSDEQAQAVAETAALLEAMNADVLLLVQGEEQILGLLAVRDERLKDAFSPEEVALLSGLAEQIAITVENSWLYQQAKERDRLAALGQMAAGLAHEIKNPLGAIKGAAQYIEEVQAAGDARSAADGSQEFLPVIVEEVDRLNRVLTDFLTYARPSEPKERLLDVNEILKRTLQLFETGRTGKVDLSLDLAADLPRVRADGERLHRVFLNLVLNAVEAMEGRENARLDVSTRLRTVRHVRDAGATAADSSRSVEVRFADNGPGISPENLQNVFIPFFTTKERGSGLGLALCQRIVRDAGGDIEVRSQPGQGAIFTVVLPAAVEEKRPSAPPSEAAGPVT